ncbi:MAG: GTPase Era, partial [Chitinophagaceae bacterium]
FGKPNAGKSTLLNTLLGEKLAITSPKVQTTRHRILGILNKPEVQIIFSDTPGIIKPEYKLHEKMMQLVKTALEDADVALFLMDARDSPEQNLELFSSLRIKSSKILVINKTDLVGRERMKEIKDFFSSRQFENITEISALKGDNIEALIEKIIMLLPECPPYYPEDMLTEKPVRFFVAELIREKIFNLYQKEIPYHTTVLVTQFEEKNTLTKISADIIVQRETQKGIILGEKGKAIKELGTLSRLDIEAFIERKVFLELHVKVRDDWRDKEGFLKEYGYN